MKQVLYDFFVWCAGSDREILDRCGRSEHIKHAGYGGLVLVPAILGVFSMVYAVSTLTPNPGVYLAAGLVWGAIVFVFDRFIVATFRKGATPQQDIFSFLFLSRLVFSIGIGILVSHPIVLLVFDDSLEQELFQMKEEGEKAIYAQYEGNIDSVRSRDNTLKGEVEVKLQERQCKEKLLLFEMSGKDTTLNCGTTSGLKQYGPRASEIKEEIRYLKEEIALLRSKNFATIDVNSTEINKLQKEREGKLAAFNQQFSTNYLAREIALERLEAKPVGGTTVRWTKWFLIIFFVLVDILPVSFKAATKPGEYDRILDLEKDLTASSTPAFERLQEDRVRQASIAELTTLRQEEAQQALRSSNSFPEKVKQVSSYLNVELPYTYGKADTTAHDTLADWWTRHGADVLRYGFFALVQSFILMLFTRDWLFLSAGIVPLFLLNAIVGTLVKRSLPA